MRPLSFPSLSISGGSALVVLFIGLAADALTVNTIPLGNSIIYPFGETDTATYGQTFLAPVSDPVLDSFTFRFDDRLDPDFVDFQGYVMAWDDALFRATGPILFESAPVTSTNNGGAGGYETFTIQTGGLALNPGDRYVAFFSVSEQFDGSAGLSDWESVTGQDAYSGGEFVFLNNANLPSQWTNWTWSGDWQGPNYDLSFRLEFSAIPEPGTGFLIATGLVAVGTGRRLRRS